MDSVVAIEQLLTSHGIDIQKYGVGTHKTVAQLFQEIKCGESTLVVVDGTLTRKLTAMFVRITRDDGKVLTETNQIFHSTSTRVGYSRTRNIPLAEKLYGDEDVDTGLRRAIKEELGIDVDTLHLDYNFTKYTETKLSESYPGLSCEYDTIDVTISASQLPTCIGDGYQHTEYFNDGTPRVTATWNWI